MSKGGRGLGRLLREERKGDHARRACKRTAAQDRHMAEELLPALGLYLPCAMARKCGGEWLRGKGGGASCCAGSERTTTRRAC